MKENDTPTKRYLFNVFPLALLLLASAVTIWSVINVQDTYLTWVLEAAPAVAWILVLILTYRHFRFPNWMYAVMFLHIIVLLVGAHYSYAEVPLGEWMKQWFGFTRNNYDKIGHFMQGFTPTLMAVEILRRKTDLKSFGWIGFLSFCVAMMITSVYEIIEWLASLSNPTDTEAFLGTQGYIWDTQSDMFCCLLGSVCALVVMLVVLKRGR
ncbi:MAG: DUF2238 domain-containing protein [Bacteroidales bacterium]|nr:DUF2238 domain-containing protein [Bacteroidales bacterium]